MSGTRPLPGGPPFSWLVTWEYYGMGQWKLYALWCSFSNNFSWLLRNGRESRVIPHSTLCVIHSTSLGLRFCSPRAVWVLPEGWTALHLMSDWRVGSEIRGLQLTAYSCEFANVHLTHPSMKRLRKAKGVALGQTQRRCINVSRAVVCSQTGFARTSSSYPQASGFCWFLFELFSCRIPSPLDYGAVF